MGLLSTKFKVCTRWPSVFLGHSKKCSQTFCYCGNSILFLVLFGINIKEHRHACMYYVFMTASASYYVSISRIPLKLIAGILPGF